MGVFTDADVWDGGLYELALEFSAGASPGLVEAAQALWKLPVLEGCYVHRDRDPSGQSRQVFDPSLMSVGHVYGVTTVPGGARVACGMCSIPELDGREWLIFYCPMGALSRAYSVGGFPFDRRNHEVWQRPLDDWLADLGRRLFDAAPFRIGLVGIEASMDHPPAIASGDVPAKRYSGILLPRGIGLEWYPRTEPD